MDFTAEFIQFAVHVTKVEAVSNVYMHVCNGFTHVADDEMSSRSTRMD